MRTYQIGAYQLHDSRWGARVFMPAQSVDGRSFHCSGPVQFKTYFPTKASAITYARGYLAWLRIASPLVEVV